MKAGNKKVNPNFAFSDKYLDVNDHHFLVVFANNIFRKLNI